MQQTIGISLEQLLKIRNDLWSHATELVSQKGHDYNYKQQLAGDTLANLRSASSLGLVDDPIVWCLGLATNKINRINSLRVVEPAVKGESFRDAVEDGINYLSYSYAFYLEKHDQLPKITKETP